MIIIAILLALFGLLILITPTTLWQISESWKSNDSTEPSDMYIWSTRFGGVMCTLAGIGGIFAYLLQ